MPYGRISATEDIDEEDRRPTQRRRVERAQAGIVDDDEDLVGLKPYLWGLSQV